MDRLRNQAAKILVLLAGGMPLVTYATCDRDAYGGNFVLRSTNDDLVEDVLDDLEDVFDD